MPDFELEWLIYRPGTKYQETFLSLWGHIRLNAHNGPPPNECLGRLKDYEYRLRFAKHFLLYQRARFQDEVIVASEHPFTILRHPVPSSTTIYFISNGRNRFRGVSTDQWRFYENVWYSQLIHKVSGDIVIGVFNEYPPELLGYNRNGFWDAGGLIRVFPWQFLTINRVTPEEYCDSTEKEYRRPWGCGYIKEYNYIIYKGAIRCPDCTCLEVDCGDKICCYGDNGKPLLYFDKPRII